MITIYYQVESGIQAAQIAVGDLEHLEKALWIDLLSPTRKEEKFVEKALQLEIPTKKEMQEIEPSSRLYTENGIIFMTATMVAQSSSPEPKTDAVTFILTEKKLITVRYIEPHSFKLFIARLARYTNKNIDAERLLAGLLDATTDRLADILEHVSHKFDDVSQTIFRSNSDTPNGINYKAVLQSIGANGDLATKVRESLVSFLRLVSFFDQACSAPSDSDVKSRLRVVTKDFQALSDYASFISGKVNFLLDATLGMVNIEQNNIIKIFSVAAVIFLPPTLIASIYGMNFRYMPELNWYVGYPIAIVLMIISAYLPYSYFKKRKWL